MYLKPCSLNLSNLFSSAVQLFSSFNSKLPLRGLFLLYCRLASRSRYSILYLSLFISSSIKMVLLTICHVQRKSCGSYVSQLSQHCTHTATPPWFGHCLVSLGFALPQAGQLLFFIFISYIYKQMLCNSFKFLLIKDSYIDFLCSFPSCCTCHYYV